MRDPLRRFAVALALASAVFFCLSTWHVFRFLAHAHEWPAFPVVTSPTGAITQTEAGAAAAGLVPGDIVVSAGGRAFGGLAGLRETIHSKRPGDTVEIRVRRGIAATVRLTPYFARKADWDDWSLTLATHVVTPFLCVALALYLLALARPARNVHLLVLVLTAFAMLRPLGGWDAPLVPFALAAGAWGQTTAATWLSLFALYFPQPGGIGYRPRWWKWAAVSLGALLFACRTAHDILLFHGPSWGWTLDLPWNALARVTALYTFAGVLLFALNLGLKALRTGDRDSRRRLRLLLLGAGLGLGPVTALLIRSAISGKDLTDCAPGWMVSWALLAICIFPATLAYIVAVRRAMDVRVLLRQGLYYSAARNGLPVVRTAAVLAVFGGLALALANGGSFPLALLTAAASLIAVQEAGLRYLKSWTDRRLVREAYQLGTLVSALRRARHSDPRELLAAIFDAVRGALGASGGCACLRSGGGFAWCASEGIPREIDLTAGALPRKLEAAQEAVACDEAGIEMLVPLHGGDGLVGVLALAAKHSGEPYTHTDRAAIAEVRDALGLLLENAMLVAVRESEAAERERRKAEAMAAREANRAKSEFLAKMSHELRTPLNAIIGYSEMLAEEAAEMNEDGFVKDLGKIRSAGKHLLDLINSVLDISKIEAGRMEVYGETFLVEQLVTDVVSMLSPVVAARGNALTTELEPGLGSMHSDAGKLRQILINLLSNASKFTEGGAIALRCRRTPEGMIRFRVRDTGIGMTPAQMQKLFQPFQQADASISAKYGGTGLGLTISKRFCELLGGSISVQSEPGSGTEFTVDLPPVLGAKPSLGETAEAAPAGDAPLVLIIDDDRAVHDIFSRSLAKEGFRTASALCAEDGIRLSAQLRPDAILLDVLLGESSGWTVMAQLRQAAPDNAPPVILMSILDEKRRGIALGADGFLVKPVDREQLKQALVKALSRRGQGSRRALVVDDEPGQRLALRRLLQNEGWKVSEGANGKEGLQILNREHLTLVLLDPITPVMDGLGFLRELRSRPGGADLPVLVVAAKDLSPRDREALAQGVDAALMKTEEGDFGDRAARELALRLRNRATGHAENTAG